MTDREFKDTLKGLEEFKKKLLSSRTTAIKILNEAGIYTPKGKLKKCYSTKS